MGVLRDPMMAFATMPVGIDVDRRATEMLKMMKELMPDLPCDVVALSHGRRPVDRHRDLGVKTMADPARSDVRHFLDAGDVACSMSDLI